MTIQSLTLHWHIDKKPASAGGFFPSRNVARCLSRAMKCGGQKEMLTDASLRVLGRSFEKGHPHTLRRLQLHLQLHHVRSHAEHDILLCNACERTVRHLPVTVHRCPCACRSPCRRRGLTPRVSRIGYSTDDWLACLPSTDTPWNGRCAFSRCMERVTYLILCGRYGHMRRSYPERFGLCLP